MEEKGPIDPELKERLLIEIDEIFEQPIEERIQNLFQETAFYGRGTNLNEGEFFGGMNNSTREIIDQEANRPRRRLTPYYEDFVPGSGILSPRPRD